MNKKAARATFTMNSELIEILEKESKKLFSNKSAVLRTMILYYKENVIDKRK